MSVEHNADGTLKASGSLAAKASNATVVHNTGDETVAGIKTFTSSPIIPTPATATQAATRGYVDTAWQAAPIYLTWNGSDYAPTALKATTTRPKIFAGPNDPAGIVGVVLGQYDIWHQTA